MDKRTGLTTNDAVTNFPLGDRTNASFPFPMNGSAFTLDQYLQMMSNMSAEFYKYYDKTIQYFASLNKVTGSLEVRRMWKIFSRTLVEFGKVFLAKVNGKLVVFNVIKEELNIDGSIKKVEGTVARMGYGWYREYTTHKFKGEDVVFVKSNFNALPLLFYWRNVICEMMGLKDAAITASIASIKKFKRNIMNNNSTIADIEQGSMIDPRTSHIDVVVDPESYIGEDNQAQRGEGSSYKDDNSVAPNSITFETNIDSAGGQWDNINKYIEFQYFQLGRRINTNKKNARNVSDEIDTETINFDILDSDLQEYIDMGIEEMKDKFGLEISMTPVIRDVEEFEAKLKQDMGGIKNDIKADNSKA